MLMQEKESNTAIALLALEKAVTIINTQSCDDMFDGVKNDLLLEIVKLRCACTLNSLEANFDVRFPVDIRCSSLLSNPKDLAVSLMEIGCDISWAAHLESLR